MAVHIQTDDDAVLNSVNLNSTTLDSPPVAGTFEFADDRVYLTNVATQRAIDRTSDVITSTTTVANTTTETTLYTGTLEANALKARNIIKVICSGIVSNVNPTHIVTIRVKIGSQTVATVTNGGTNSLSDTPWDIEYRTIIRTVGATASVSTHVHLGIEGENTEDVTQLNTIDTTVAENITVTAQWDTADAGDTISIYDGFMEFKN